MPRASVAAAQPVTPRKRKTGSSDAPTPTTRSKGKARGPPTPNPPLVPFPTPPSSRHRDRDIPLHFPLDESTSSFDSDYVPPQKSLPVHLETLSKLHHAFNLSLSLHFATHPPVLPPHSPSTTKLELTNLTNFLSIKGTIERTAGRRFGLPELGRLAWLWTWDGESLPQEELVSLKAKEEEERKDPLSPKRDSDNPFLVSEGPADSQSVCGLSYVITPTRTLDPSTGRRVHTYGLGIELDLKPGETRNLLSELEGSSSREQGGGAGAIARWNGNGESREKEIRRKLDRWVELHGGYEPPVQNDLPTPQTTSNQRSTIPPIPLLPLPRLPSATLLPSANIFATASSAIPIPRPSSTSNIPGLADPFVMEDKDKSTKVNRPGSVEERRKAMMDRIKARSGSSRTPTLGSSIGHLDSIRPRQSAQAEELKRRSTLSRLEGIAEAIWMMFSSPSPGPNTLPTPPRGRRKAIPLSEVSDVIVKSSKTPISLAEAQDSIKMLADLCPFFLNLKVVAKQEWVEMPSSALATCPTSPGSGLGTGIRMSPQSYPSPSSRRVPAPPASPTPGSRRIMAEPSSPSPGGKVMMPPRSPTSPTLGAFDRATSPSPVGRGTKTPAPPASPTLHKSPRIPSSPTLGGSLAGPASPGRVKRFGGLRQVRERIRRELGD